jgi:hypothetical protein
MSYLLKACGKCGGTVSPPDEDGERRCLNCAAPWPGPRPARQGGG